MKCTCTENEICEAHRLVWDFQEITQKLGNQLESELDSQKLCNSLPTKPIGDTNEKRPNLPEQIHQGA
jgi:hypothetical protein